VRGGRTTGVVLVAMLALAKADAATIGVLAPALRSQFHLDDASLGLLASLASITGALSALPAGGLVDRRHRPILLAGALAIWSVALGVAGLATGFVVLAVARLVSGCVSTVARPAAVSLVGDLYRHDRRGRVMAALDAGQSAGTAVCFVIGALALHWFSWRAAFWCLAVVGVILAVLAGRLHDPDRPATERDRTPPSMRAEQNGPSMRAVLRELVSIRTNVVVLLAEAVGNFFYAGVTSFGVLFATERFGLSTARVDAVAPLIGVGVIVGLLAGGRFGDRMARRAGGGRRLVLACVLDLVAAGLLVPAVAFRSVVVCGLLLVVASAVLAGSGPCLDAVRIDIVRPAIRGRAEAARGLLTFGAGAVAPIVFGLVAMSLGGRQGHGEGLRDAFLLMLIPLAASGLILVAGLRSYDADAEAAGTPAGRPLGPVDTSKGSLKSSGPPSTPTFPR
jgi:predicted MFS family arabinose efflux permease